MSQRNHSHFFEKYGATFGKALWHYLIWGLIANWNEYEYSQAHEDPRVMPTVRKFLGGWIVVQYRGKPVSAEEFTQSRFANALVFREVGKPWQFCRHPDGRVVLVDYGMGETREWLEDTSQGEEKLNHVAETTAVAI